MHPRTYNNTIMEACQLKFQFQLIYRLLWVRSSPPHLPTSPPRTTQASCELRPQSLARLDGFNQVQVPPSWPGRAQWRPYNKLEIHKYPRVRCILSTIIRLRSSFFILHQPSQPAQIIFVNPHIIFLHRLHGLECTHHWLAPRRRTWRRRARPSYSMCLCSRRPSSPCFRPGNTISSCRHAIH